MNHLINTKNAVTVTAFLLLFWIIGGEWIKLHKHAAARAELAILCKHKPNDAACVLVKKATP